MPETPKVDDGDGEESQSGIYCIYITERIVDPGEDACMIKRLGAAGFLLILLLSTVTCSLAGKTVLMTFTGDCTLGSEEINRKKPDSFDSCIEKNGYD